MLDPFAHRKILNRGQPARATVLAVSTPATRARATQVAMTLEIQPPSGPPYEVCDRWAAAGTEPVTEGSELRVVIDPSDRRRVAIDWERSHSQYRERSEVRREVMAGGIPRPVSAVRQAMSERLPTATPKVGVAPPAPVAPVAAGKAPPADKMIERLERLAALHRSGALTADEFSAAKRHVLGLS